MTLRIAPLPDDRLSPLERLEVLADPGSLHLLRTDVRSKRMGPKARAGDGVVGGTCRVDGRPVACFAQDPSFAGGSLGEAHADTVVKVLQLAGRSRMPVVGFIESAGARMQEGLSALGGYGRIFREHVKLSGVVPQISVICGASAGGGSYAPALTDFVIMTERASMFLTGPGIVQEVTGENVDAATLGGPRVHERNGVAQFVADTEIGAALLARDLLDYLPQHGGLEPQRWPTTAAPVVIPDAYVPDSLRKPYDVRNVAKSIVDSGRLLEFAPKFAPNVVCGFARLDGRSIGIVANQPQHIAGVLDAAASQKAAKFVRTCNLFGLPLVVLVDTPGFMPGTEQEAGAVIRHGAKLVHAFAEATVPRITVVLRKAFGGAYIAMNSKDLGADFVFAWPQAQIGVMGAHQAVGITHKREIAASDDPLAARDAFAELYAGEHLDARAASAEGFVDDVIAPSTTRARIAGALDALESAVRPPRSAGNIPL